MRRTIKSKPIRLLGVLVALIIGLSSTSSLAGASVSSTFVTTGAKVGDPLGWQAIDAALNDPRVAWTLCAQQGGYCSFGGTKMVRYGLPGKYAYQILTNGAACVNRSFPNDPLPGRKKYCAYRSWPPAAPTQTVPVAGGGVTAVVPTTLLPTTLPTTTNSGTAPPAATTTPPTPPTTASPTTTAATVLPSTAPAGNVTGRPFGPTSPWNTPTPTNTAWYDSLRLHTMPIAVNGDYFQHWYVNTDSVGIYYAQPTDPVWTFKMPAYIAPLWNRNRPAQTFQVHGPANMIDGGDEDHILVVVDGGRYYEVWNAQVDQATRTVTNRPSGPGWATGDFVNGPGAGTTATNDGVRASNFSWAGGLITGEDLAAGKIEHALVIALPNSMLKAGGTPDYRWPATAWDNGGAVGPIKMGSRVGIPAGTARPAGLSALGNSMFDALVKYGAFVGDYCGGPWPMFYADKFTVTLDQMRPLFTWWDYGGSSDMEKLGPLLRIADYQA